MNKTLECLAKAFAGESQARNRYTFYAKTAQKEGYEQIAAIFLETAEQEKQHAKTIYRMMSELTEKLNAALPLSVETEVPVVFSSTIENIKGAIAGEHHEQASMYPEFAQIAQEEGFMEIASKLKAIGRAEVHHEERYGQLLKELESGSVFKKDQDIEWACRKCGYVHSGSSAPEKCPSCDHPTAYFEVRCEKY